MPVRLNSSGGGSVTLDVPGTASTFSLNLPTTNGSLVSADNNGNVTVTGDLVPSSSFLRNRIINGGMRIDERNFGASGTANAYTVDRWGYSQTQASRFTWQRNAGSVTPPTGFTNYLGFTSSGANAPISTDSFVVSQAIEGVNVSDLGWGAVGAQTVTLSFWVRSLLTGTHSGSLRNSGNARSYVFTFSVAAANTWEYKTVTVPGDTSGTWNTTDGIGINVAFNLGSGSNFQTTAGSWTSGNFTGATGSVNVCGTSGATFYITGVQLEVGSSATPFERRHYGQELMLCQRYYQIVDTRLAGYTASGVSNSYRGKLAVSMRATPTVSVDSIENINTTGATVAAIGNEHFQHFSTGSSTAGFISSAVGRFSAEL